jgi:hypothetical protein
MARVLSFSKVDAYFQELADKHIDIKDYCSTSIEELANKMATVAGIQPYFSFFRLFW